MTSLMIDTIGPTRPTYSIRLETPDGTMFVHIEEEKDLPVKCSINIGKAGSRLMAWADCTSRLVSMLLKNRIPLEGILEELSGIHSDKLVYSGGIEIQSGPDGLAQALIIYRRNKANELFAAGKAEWKPPFIKNRGDE